MSEKPKKKRTSEKPDKKHIVTVIKATSEEAETVVYENDKQFHFAFMMDMRTIPADLSREGIEALRELSRSFLMFFKERPSDNMAEATVRSKAKRIINFAEFINEYRGGVCPKKRWRKRV